jgi:hypothetical protein
MQLTVHRVLDKVLRIWWWLRERISAPVGRKRKATPPTRSDLTAAGKDAWMTNVRKHAPHLAQQWQLRSEQLMAHQQWPLQRGLANQQSPRNQQGLRNQQSLMNHPSIEAYQLTQHFTHFDGEAAPTHPVSIPFHEHSQECTADLFVESTNPRLFKDENYGVYANTIANSHSVPQEERFERRTAARRLPFSPSSALLKTEYPWGSTQKKSVKWRSGAFSVETGSYTSLEQPQCIHLKSLWAKVDSETLPRAGRPNPHDEEPRLAGNDYRVDAELGTHEYEMSTVSSEYGMADPWPSLLSDRAPEPSFATHWNPADLQLLAQEQRGA